MRTDVGMGHGPCEEQRDVEDIHTMITSYGSKSV